MLALLPPPRKRDIAAARKESVHQQLIFERLSSIYSFFMASSHPSKHSNKPPVTSILDSPTSYLLCELTIDGRTAADCALCRDIIQSACRACIGSIGTGLASMSVVKQCSPSVFIVSVASSHLSDVWAAITIASSFEKRGTSTLSFTIILCFPLEIIYFIFTLPLPPSCFPRNQCSENRSDSVEHMRSFSSSHRRLSAELAIFFHRLNETV
jgi:hypothetical protein